MGSGRRSVVHGAATLSLAGLLGVVFALAPGPVRRWALGGAALIVVGGALYALFGAGDWTPGGRHRHHATFIVIYAALAGGGTVAVRSVVPPYGTVGRALQVLALVYGLAVAGWVAYLGGARVLGDGWTRAVSRARSAADRPDAGGD